MYKKITLAALLALPVPVFAQTTLLTVIGIVQTLIGRLIPLFVSCAVVVFFWGIVKFIGHADDERSVAEGKAYMIWGLVGIFVIIALWAIVGYIQQSFGLGGAGPGGGSPGIPIVVPVP